VGNLFAAGIGDGFDVSRRIILVVGKNQIVRIPLDGVVRRDDLFEAVQIVVFIEGGAGAVGHELAAAESVVTELDNGPVGGLGVVEASRQVVKIGGHDAVAIPVGRDPLHLIICVAFALEKAVPLVDGEFMGGVAASDQRGCDGDCILSGL